MYTNITKKEGERILPLIWTIDLWQNDNYFVNPFSERRLRCRSIIRKPQTPAEKLLVYLHLSPQESFPDLSPSTKTIYLYGAFNQITVYQVRCLGNIRKMKASEKNWFIKKVLARLTKQQNIGDELGFKPSVREQLVEAAFVRVGSYYLFEPVEYARRSYERG